MPSWTSQAPPAACRWSDEHRTFVFSGAGAAPPPTYEFHMRGSAKTPFQKEYEPNLRQTAPPRASYKGPKAWTQCDVESDPFESVYGQDPRMAGEDPFDIATTTARRCLPTRRGLCGLCCA